MVKMSFLLSEKVCHHLLFEVFCLDLINCIIESVTALNCGSLRKGLGFTLKFKSDFIVVVALLFYVHGKHLRSCRDGQLT